MFCLHSAWWMSLLHRCVAATARSPLLKNLMQFLGVLFTMYKDDIENFLSADKSTGEEVLFDLRRYAEQKKQDRKQVRPIVSTSPTVLTDVVVEACVAVACRRC